MDGKLKTVNGNRPGNRRKHSLKFSKKNTFCLMNNILAIIIVFISMILSCNNKSSLQQESESSGKFIYKVLSTNEFESKLKQEHKNYLLLDVRTPEELEETGYIEGAINIDVEADGFIEKVNRLDKSKTIMVYCRSGGRSSTASEMMKDEGFKEIYDLEGGITEWKEQEKPVVKE